MKIVIEIKNDELIYTEIFSGSRHQEIRKVDVNAITTMSHCIESMRRLTEPKGKTDLEKNMERLVNNPELLKLLVAKVEQCSTENNK